MLRAENRNFRRMNEKRGEGIYSKEVTFIRIEVILYLTALRKNLEKRLSLSSFEVRNIN